MIAKRNLLKILTLSVATGLLATPASAAVLMLDFGPTTVSGASLTNSPYHTTAPLFTDTDWNHVEVADVAAGSLRWSDGTTATGVSLNLGATTSSGSTTVLLAQTPSGNSALGAATSTGIYSGTSVGTDGIFTGSGTRYVGFQLSGLAAGTYDIYVAARATSSGSNNSQNLYAGASSTSGDFNALTLGQTDSVSFASGSAATSVWADGSNFMKVQVSITSGQHLNLAVVGGGGELRGFLNAVQIVSVPEPGTPLLLAGAGMLFTIVRRRRSAV